MLDRLEAMSILLHAVDAGSLSKASRALRLPLATVSRKVAELEAQLGASLLIRSARGLTPTPAGRSFVDAARSILEQLTEAERAAAGEYLAPRGDLVVTAPVMFGRLHVLPVVADFLRSFPEVGVQLVLTDRVTHLIDDQIDVALRIGEPADTGLMASRLGSVRRVICASPAYFAERGMPTAPDQLRNHIAVFSETAPSSESCSFGKADGDFVPPPRSRLSVNSVEAAIDAALAGMGVIRVLSYQVAGLVAQGALRVALADFEPAPRPVQLVYNGDLRLPLKLRAFIDFTAPRLRDRLVGAVILC